MHISPTTWPHGSLTATHGGRGSESGLVDWSLVPSLLLGWLSLSVVGVVVSFRLKYSVLQMQQIRSSVGNSESETLGSPSTYSLARAMAKSTISCSAWSESAGSKSPSSPVGEGSLVGSGGGCRSQGGVESLLWTEAASSFSTGEGDSIG